MTQDTDTDTRTAPTMPGARTIAAAESRARTRRARCLSALLPARLGGTGRARRRHDATTRRPPEGEKRINLMLDNG